MDSKQILIKNAAIIVNPKKVIPDGFILIKDGVVEDVGESARLACGPQARVAGGRERIVINAGGRVVMPGFVNPHMHLYSYFAKGMAVSRITSFGEILEKLWWPLDKVLSEEDIYYSGVLGLIEAIKSGVTTVVDHHASYGKIRNSLSTLACAFLKVGVRGSLCFEVSDRNGKNARDEAVKENIAFIEECARQRKEEPNYLLRGMMGLHASMTLSDQTLAMARDVMDKFNVGAHIHVAEGTEDATDARQKYNKSVVNRLYDEKILRKGTIAVHCVHVDDNDLELLRKSGAFIVHNPLSNLNNAVGIAPFLEMHERKIPVGVGTDGMSAGIFSDVKAAAFLHKIKACDPQIGFLESFKSTMEINPQIASSSFGMKFGVLEKGEVADIVITEYMPPTPLTSENIWGHILFGAMNFPVRTTICAGRILMQDFEIKTVDEAKTKAEAREHSEKLWRRIK